MQVVFIHIFEYTCISLRTAWPHSSHRYTGYTLVCGTPSTTPFTTPAFSILLVVTQVHSISHLDLHHSGWEAGVSDSTASIDQSEILSLYQEEHWNSLLVVRPNQYRSTTPVERLYIFV